MPDAQRTVVVTGANGLVGSRLVARLSAEGGTEVIAVGRGAVRGPALARVRYVELDLLGPGGANSARGPAGSDRAEGAGGLAALGALIERERPAAVLHAAAMTDVDACEREPASAKLVNETACAVVARAATRVGARLVALSTDYVFDGEAGPYDEEARPNPRGVYATTKLAGERAAQEHAPGAIIARVAVIFSGQGGAKKTFAVSAADALAQGREVKAFHDQVVSPTLADNAAALVLSVLRFGAPGVYHCAGATALSRVDFCRRLARRLGADERLVVPVALAELKLPAPRPLRCALVVDKVTRLLEAAGRSGLRSDGLDLPLGIDDALDRFLAERAEVTG